MGVEAPPKWLSKKGLGGLKISKPVALKIAFLLTAFPPHVTIDDYGKKIFVNFFPNITNGNPTKNKIFSKIYFQPQKRSKDFSLFSCKQEDKIIKMKGVIKGHEGKFDLIDI